MKNEIPEQEEGSQMDVFEKKEFAEELAAKVFYPMLRKRLLEVYKWDERCGFASATFVLTDAVGKPVEREAQAGDHFKINIPGPGPTLGDGFDWVLVEEIREEESAEKQITMMRARPVPNPEKGPASEDETAHFLKHKATSTFIISRIGKEVSAEVHGRNEIANTDTPVLIDNIRNVLVGWSAKIGISYPQWKSLVVALLKPE